MLRKYHFNDDNLNEAKAINLIQLLNVMFHAPPRPPPPPAQILNSLPTKTFNSSLTR